MTLFATITSQGQMSIPAVLKKMLSLGKDQKVTLHADGKKIVLETAGDILSLEGTLSHRARQRHFTQETLAKEEEVLAQSIMNRYQKK